MGLSLEVLLIAASLAYAVTQLTSLGPVRTVAEAVWAPLGKLTRCPYCLGFWATLATMGAYHVPESAIWPPLGGMILGSSIALRWGWRTLLPGMALGALLGALGAGPVFLLASGYPLAYLVSWGLLGALTSLATTAALQAPMAYAASLSRSRSDVP